MSIMIKTRGSLTGRRAKTARKREDIPNQRGPHKGLGVFGDPSGLPPDDLMRARLALIYRDMNSRDGQIHWGKTDTWEYQPTHEEIVQFARSLQKKFRQKTANAVESETTTTTPDNED